jgi:hypothetical protein
MVKIKREDGLFWIGGYELASSWLRFGRFDQGFYLIDYSKSLGRIFI